jgi:hypothetical protein
MLAVCLLFRELAFEQSANAALPPLQHPRLVLPLSLELRLQTTGETVGVPMNATTVMSRDHRMGTEDHRQGSVGLRVIVIREAEDRVQEGPMPVTEQFEHERLTTFFRGERVQAEGSAR